MKQIKEPKLTIDPANFDDLESEQDWNFDDSFLKPNEALKKLNPELSEVLERHANADKDPAKKD